jgi:histidine phosphotransferase ChpT
LQTLESTRLAALIASRICHDLVSPVSSVTHALDLMDEPGDDEMKAQARVLLSEGAEKTVARIKFLRYALGAVGLNAGIANVHEVKQMTEDYARAFKPSVDWDIQYDALTVSQARLMMNLVMMAVETLPRSGVVHILIRADGDALNMTLTCKGDRAKLKEDNAKALMGVEPADGWKSENIQPYFARLISAGMGGEVTVKQGDGFVVLSAQNLRLTG